LHLKFNNPENANFLANSGLFFCNLINQVLNRRGFQDFRKTLVNTFVKVKHKVTLREIQ
jgi:hypothetical protein